MPERAPLGSSGRARFAKDFIGRGADLALLEDRIARGTPLVTITGAAGVGKTELASRFAAAYAGAPGDEPVRLAFCDLTEARDVRSLCAAVTAALDIPIAEHADDLPVVEAIGAALASFGTALVVLDNFEQAVAHAPSTVGLWLDRAPEVQFLVTSRERLRLPGEVVHEVRPLSLKASDATGGVDPEAAQLWTACVRTQHPGYEITPAEGPIVEALLRELDGLPLAIELAAGRYGMLSVSELLARLGRSLDVLGQGARGAGARQATLRGAIDWSWELLEPWERTALAECSVFRGAIDLEGAESIVDVSAHEGAPPVLDVVQALRDKSLMALSPWCAPGEATMALRLSVRKYAEEKLASMGHERKVHERHAAYFRGFAEQLAKRARRAESGRSAFERLVAHRENFLAAIERCLAPAGSSHDVETALRILVALADASVLHPLYASLFRPLEQALTHPAAPGVDTLVRGNALVALAAIAEYIGRPDTAERNLAEAVAIAQQLGARVLEARCHEVMTFLRIGRGEWEDAARTAERGLALALESRDSLAAGAALHALGTLGWQRGSPDEGRRRAEQALEIFSRVGDLPREAMTRVCLLGIHLDLGALELAHAHEDRVRIVHEIVGVAPQPFFSFEQGLAAHEEGRFAAASARYEEARDVARASGVTRVEAYAIAYGAIALFEQDDLAAARMQLLDGLPSLRGVADRSYSGMFSAVLGAFEASFEHLERARELCDAAEVDLGTNADTAAHLVVRLCRGHLWHAEAKQAEARGDVELARRLREQARARVAEGRASPHARSSWEVRTAIRMLARLLGMAAEPPKSRAKDRPLLRFESTGSWFDPPRGGRIRCARRPILRSILLALVQAHPTGGVLTAEDLFHAGWPEEKVSAATAKNRVHVMLSKLRDLGLREVLLARDDGYFFDPDLRLEPA